MSSGISVGEAIENNIKKVIKHGKFILGPEVNELESKLANYVNVKHCIGASSGTDALLLALMGLDIKPGDEVITTPFSFIATAETIVLLGAIPVFVDIDPITYNINPDNLTKAISSKTKAIIAVSLYGQPADFSSINSVASQYGIPVIEDAAQSFGSTHYNKKSCNLCLIGVTSFFPTKPLGGYGDGGACFTSDDQIAEKIRKISKHGSARRYYHTEVGINGRLDTIQAAILLVKLQIFDDEIDKRTNVANYYKTLLHNHGFKKTPIIENGNTSVFAQYTIQVNEREKIQSFLNKEGIPTAVHYPLPLNDQPALRDRCISKNCEITSEISKNVLSLPFHPYLEKLEQEKVVEALINAVNTLSWE